MMPYNVKYRKKHYYFLSIAYNVKYITKNIITFGV